MDIPQDLAADLKGYPQERAMQEPIGQAQLWHQILLTATSDQELLLVRESLIYALPPRKIYALHPDQFANVAAIYRMKHNLFQRLQHNQAIERLCSEQAFTPGGDT